MREVTYQIAELLPHTPPMILLDRVTDWDEGRVTAQLTIRPDSPFFILGKGVPTHVALEYMAQTCGCYAGLEGLTQGVPVRLGYLLGTRNFQAACDWFTEGSLLTITAHEMLRQDGMGVFDCRILCEDIEAASAQLNLYRPESGQETKRIDAHG